MPHSAAVPRHVHPPVGAARARLAVLVREGASPEQVEAARARLREANAEAAVQRVVDSFPPLTDEQRSRLALLLAPAGST